ncbi:Gfo/Idh/MocA family oxidoreductase [Streptacidiphilus sp. PB12-B1b]|uniref:Gfo/Idh/MocA family oxidoreductase n=1 Tax=Streptacidiphilus sp. PB12-B1b TaxID=2705012 RepID=UPI0015F8E14C|nr:Gfo/Idh/MocA family oxidoreductase [Streptacidiphilus sp. PB12-B1b]QMU75427.1 Gfo/Idh/MocA family oxidoreductase [Streptacidiphilus sp. PB12-B1b]
MTTHTPEHTPGHTPDRRLRVGLIGYGLAGSVFHAPLISTTPGLSLAAVVTANPERQAQARAEHPGVAVVDGIDGLWPLDLDLVVVASPNRLHVAHATAALEAGVAVVVDKPLAASAEEADALNAHAERLGLPLSVFQNRRWDGDFLTVAELVRSGRLGTVHRFESRFERWRPQLKGGWRELGDPAEAGGLLYDLGSHLVDQALTLFGPVAEVYAEVDCRRDGAQADDDAFVALRHANGVRSHLWMSAVTGSLGPRFRVLGSESAYVCYGLDGQEAALREGRTPADDGWGAVPESAYGLLGAGEEAAPHPTLPGRYQHYYAQVAEALHGRAPLPVEGRDAVATLAVLAAARRSAAERQLVPLGPEQG